MATSSIFLFLRTVPFLFDQQQHTVSRMSHTWIEADLCVLFILVFLLASHEAFPIFSNVFSLTAAEVNRMLPRFLTRQTRSNQRVFPGQIQSLAIKE